jgi:hypothetical protein
MIETPPHKDGHGSQSAYHLCLFGDGANRVFFWKPVLDKTAQQLHRVLSIPAKPNLPHDVTGYSFSSSRDDWERKVTANGPLKEHLFKRVMLSKSKILLLPAAFAHLFTKVAINLSSYYLHIVRSLMLLHQAAVAGQSLAMLATSHTSDTLTRLQQPFSHT